MGVLVTIIKGKSDIHSAKDNVFFKYHLVYNVLHISMHFAYAADDQQSHSEIGKNMINWLHL